MNTYLLLWNPSKFSWKKPDVNEDIVEDVELVKNTGKCLKSWNCGVIKKIKKGDRIFLLKLGTEPKGGNPKNPKGILASGYAIKTYQHKHYNEPKDVQYIEVEFEVLLNPEKQPILTLEDLEKINKGNLNRRYWTPLSAKSIEQTIAQELETLWSNFLN